MREKDKDIERKRERESERHLRPQGREVKARAVESLLRRSAHLNIFYFPLNPPLFPSDQHQNQFVIEIAGDKTVRNDTQVKKWGLLYFPFLILLFNKCRQKYNSKYSGQLDTMMVLYPDLLVLPANMI